MDKMIDDIENLTLIQMYALLEHNGVIVDISMLSQSAMAKIIIDRDIDITKAPSDDVDWKVENTHGEEYALNIYAPIRFSIMVKDEIIAPDDRRYAIVCIELDNYVKWYDIDASKEEHCRVIIEDVENKEQRVLTGAEMIECVNCEDTVYTKSSWCKM